MAKTQQNSEFILTKEVTNEQKVAAESRTLNEFPKYANGTTFTVESVDYCAYIVKGQRSKTATLALIGKIGEEEVCLALSLFVKDYLTRNGDIINLSSELSRAVQEDYATSDTGEDFRKKCEKRFKKGFKMVAQLKGYVSEWGVRKYNDWVAELPLNHIEGGNSLNACISHMYTGDNLN